MDVAKRAVLELLEHMKQPVDPKDREMLRMVARTSLRTKVRERVRARTHACTTLLGWGACRGGLQHSEPEGRCGVCVQWGVVVRKCSLPAALNLCPHPIPPQSLLPTPAPPPCPTHSSSCRRRWRIS